MRRKTLLGMLLAAMVLSLSACSKEETQSTTVVATTIAETTKTTEQVTEPVETKAPETESPTEEETQKPTHDPNAEEQVEDFIVKYKDNSKTCSIVDYVGDADHIVFPDKIGKYKVVDIAIREADKHQNVVSITIPAYYKESHFDPEDVLWNLPNVTEYLVENNEFFETEDGILFNKNFRKLLLCPRGRSGEITVKQEITGLGAKCFTHCEKLTGIYLPGTIVKVDGYGPFEGCTNIKKFMLCGELSHDAGLFAGMTGLEKLMIVTDTIDIKKNDLAGLDHLRALNVYGTIASFDPCACYETQNQYPESFQTLTCNNPQDDTDIFEQLIHSNIEIYFCEDNSATYQFDNNQFANMKLDDLLDYLFLATTGFYDQEFFMEAEIDWAEIRETKGNGYQIYFYDKDENKVLRPSTEGWVLTEYDEKGLETRAYLYQADRKTLQYEKRYAAHDDNIYTIYQTSYEEGKKTEDSIEVELIYDENGELISQRKLDGSLWITYKNGYRVTYVSIEDDIKTEATYDDNGNPLLVVTTDLEAQEVTSKIKCTNEVIKDDQGRIHQTNTTMSLLAFNQAVRLTHVYSDEQ